MASLIRFAGVNVARSVARSAVRASSVARGYAEEAVADSVNLTFSTPYMAFYDASTVDRVDVPGIAGDFGVLQNHVPLLDCLRPGVVNVVVGDVETKYFVSSGTVTVNADSSVQIIAEEACLLSDLDAQAARAGLDAHTSKLSSSDDAEKAEAEIGVEVHTQMLKALE